MDRKGQALVETAIILPALMFSFLVVSLLVVIACMKIKLLYAASRTAQAAATGDQVLSSTDPLPGWKRYSGISTLDKPGRLVVIEKRTVLSARHFWNFPLPYQTLHARVAFMEEPRIPGEQN